MEMMKKFSEVMEELPRLLLPNNRYGRDDCLWRSVPVGFAEAHHGFLWLPNNMYGRDDCL